MHLGQPSVTTNPLLAHTTHAIHPPADGIHFLDFVKIDDHIHMLSCDDTEPEPIMSNGIYEIDIETLGPRMPVSFGLVPEAASVQTATVEPLIFPHYSVRMLRRFRLRMLMILKLWMFSILITTKKVHFYNLL